MIYKNSKFDLNIMCTYLLFGAQISHHNLKNIATLNSLPLISYKIRFRFVLIEYGEYFLFDGRIEFPN